MQEYVCCIRKSICRPSRDQPTYLSEMNEKIETIMVICIPTPYALAFHVSIIRFKKEVVNLARPAYRSEPWFGHLDPLVPHCSYCSGPAPTLCGSPLFISVRLLGKYCCKPSLLLKNAPVFSSLLISLDTTHGGSSRLPGANRILTTSSMQSSNRA